MSHRWLLALLTAGALVMTGCGSDKVTVTAPSSKNSSTASSSAQSSSEETSSAESSSEETSTAADAPLETLDTDACAELTGANLDLALASTTEDAKKEADIFAKYNPPSAVQDAIDHFVSTEGPQLTDPDYDKDDKTITAWVKAVCP